VKEEDYYCCERWAGSFERRLTLPSGVDADKVKATFKNGIPEVRLPKVDKAKGKRSRSRPSETCQTAGGVSPPAVFGGRMARTEKRILSLGELPEGARARLHRFQGGREFLGRMAALGFSVGASLHLLQNTGRGPVIVLIRDTRVALGRGEASKVLVEQEEGEDGDSYP